MLRLTLVIGWKLATTLTGLDLVATTIEIVTEVVRTARTRPAKPNTATATAGS